MSDPQLALEEYRALRATVRERGTARLVIAVVTFVAWAALAMAAIAVLPSISWLALLPLVPLAAGFEVVFAAHVGVERIGRFLAVTYERDEPPLPRWERAVASVGPARPHGGVDPLFGWLFIAATLLNLAPLALVAATADPTWWHPDYLGPTLLHAAFIVRVLSARRFARGQRARDTALFEATRTRR